MKILYFTTSCQMAGTEKILYELATGLDREKFNILVCTIKSNDGNLLFKLKEAGIATETLNLNSKVQFFKVLKLIQIIKNFKPDVIQSFLFFDNILSRIFGRICGVSIIISGQRNVETHRSKLRNFIDRITIPLTDFFISNTEAGKKKLIEREKIFPSKILIIQNGIDLKVIHSVLDDQKKNRLLNGIITDIQILGQETKIIGFVGYLEKQKGVRYLLEAFSKLETESIDSVVLVIIGDGSVRNELEEFARKLKIENRVYFLGHMKEAMKFMFLFDIFVLPSLWEGMPNVILEAMTFGLPIIATDVGGVPEIITDGKNGFLVRSKNSKILSEKIKYVLNLSGQERKKIGDEARKRIEDKFSLEKMIKNYQNFYQGLIKKKQSA